MTEWLLIITLHATSLGSGASGLDVEVIDGFSTEEACRVASESVGKAITDQWLNHQAAEGLDLGGEAGRPMVFSDCEKVEK